MPIQKGLFWIKVDGTDLKPALQESKKEEWNGDADMSDSTVKVLRAEYEKRAGIVTELSSDKNRTRLQQHLTTTIDHFDADTQWLHKSLGKTIKVYQKKTNSPTTSEESLKEVNWEIVELSNLIEQSKERKETYENMLPLLSPQNPDPAAVNKKHKVQEPDTKRYLTAILKKKRRQPAASHVLVVMVSDEERKKKPYALPVQYVPYHSLGDQWVRDLTTKLKERMVFHGLTVVGTLTDGEFSSLRTQGGTRALHLWQLIHDAREGVSKMQRETLKKYLVQVGVNDDGTPVTEANDPRIPSHVITKLHDIMQELDFSNAIHHIRNDLVPEGYTHLPWRVHVVPESQLDMLRSIVGTYQIRASVEELKQEGVHFSKHLYVPEVDITTGQIHHEREDHNHILKRIAKHTREAGHDDIDVRRFGEAMLSDRTDLGHAALVGLRKQSVRDAEKLVSHAVKNFFVEKGYTAEAEYVKLVADWHEAADGRGLSQEDRRAANLAMKNYILDRWMPWHRDDSDLSKIDINRYF
ncbi:uncharacterized protein LOC118429887 [Branchiostoma floridae]|uniref:Uncharacterized protein LOC118429887 n=1 Tax=Branchiostoma floridae TaxID=7739 RepID=A0A9J7NA62_BRAFL|nr:uncharacterized protein LOC118429887 [Branchiostoma floridae]